MESFGRCWLLLPEDETSEFRLLVEVEVEVEEEEDEEVMLLAADAAGLVSMLKRTVVRLVLFVVTVRPAGSIVAASAWGARPPQELCPADLASCYSTPFLILPGSRSDARWLLSSFDLDIFSGW